MDTQGTGYIHNRQTHHSSLNPKVKPLAWEIPQLQIAGHPEAKSGLESLELALFLFSFLKICYRPLSLLDSIRKDGSEPEKQLRAFLGREPNTQAGGGANAGWLCLAVPSQATKKTLKITRSLLLQPPSGSLQEHPGQSWEEAVILWHPLW